MSSNKSILASLISGVFLLAAAADVSAHQVSEQKFPVPKTPVTPPSAPNVPPIRRANILDVFQTPRNREQRRHGFRLG